MILGAHMVDANVSRLQNALNALGFVKSDPRLRVAVDGMVGPATVKAMNHALIAYIVQGAGRAPKWRTVTADTIKNQAGEMAMLIEQAAGVPGPQPAPAAPASYSQAPSRSAQVAAFFRSLQPSQEFDMFPQQPGYYPQQPYYAPGSYPYGQAPGGLPNNQASLDVKAFIPAQYEHVRLTPATGMAILLGAGLVIMALSQYKVAKK